MSLHQKSCHPDGYNNFYIVLNQNATTIIQQNTSTVADHSKKVQFSFLNVGCSERLSKSLKASVELYY